MNWLTIKAKLWAFGAFLWAVLAAILHHKKVVSQRDKFREQRDAANREVEERRAVDEADVEIESEYSDLEREAERDLEEGRMPDVIRNRNRR